MFFINVPLAVAVLGLTLWRVPESRSSRTRGALDWLGAVLATLGLAAVVYALIEAPTRGWGSPLIQCTLVLGVAGLATFVVVEARNVSAMIPLRLFRSRIFSGANLLTFLLYAALGGGLFYLPLNLIQVQRYSATAAGAALLPFILLMFTLSRWSGGLIERYGARLPLVLGPMVAAVGFALFAVPSTDAGYWTEFFPAVMVLGFGMAVSVAPLTTTVMNSVDASYSGVASGINNAASRVAALIAVAAFGVVLTLAFDRALDANLARNGASAESIEVVKQQRDKLAAIELPATLQENERHRVRHAIDESFVAGFRWVMAISALLALASAISAWALIREPAGALPP